MSFLNGGNFGTPLQLIASGAWFGSADRRLFGAIYRSGLTRGQALRLNRRSRRQPAISGPEA